MKPIQPPQTPPGPQRPQKFGPASDLEDTFGGILDAVAKICLYGGLLAMLVGVIFLLTTYQVFAGGGSEASIAQGMNNIELLSKVLFAGCVCAMVGSTYIWWGEETLGVFQLLVGGALWSTPLWVPSMLGSGNGKGAEVAGKAIGAVSMGGTIFAGLAIIVLVVDIAIRVKQRAQQGSKSDQLKYGKGVKEEDAPKNVLMGKCWQLPFCRKFVREACPIYHAKRTCWREKVGCMCEEEVIRKAMTGTNTGTISKDSVAAARFIPVNNRLTMEQKKERCRMCVIYNEHQKHKYKLWLPVVVAGFALFYVLFRTQLIETTGTIMTRMDRLVSGLTLSSQKTPTAAAAAQSGNAAFTEILLICLMIVILAYVLKMLEYVIFKLKI